MKRAHDEVISLLAEAKELFRQAVEACRASEEGRLPRHEALEVARKANDRASELVRRALDIARNNVAGRKISNGRDDNSANYTV